MAARVRSDLATLATGCGRIRGGEDNFVKCDTVSYYNDIMSLNHLVLCRIRMGLRMDNENENTDQGLICAFDLDGKGEGRELSWSDINEAGQADVVRWVHLDHSARDSKSWLATESGLDETIVDALLEAETRPRCLETGDGILLSLRGINLNPDAQSEDMVSIRVWLDSERIITTRHRRLQSIQKIRDELLVCTGPKDQAEFLQLLIAYLGNNIAVVIESLDESIDQFEVTTGVSTSSTSHGNWVVFDGKRLTCEGFWRLKEKPWIIFHAHRADSCLQMLSRNSMKRQTAWSCTLRNWTLPANGPWWFARSC